MDYERIYRLLYERQWMPVLDVLHRHHADLAGDPGLARAASVFLDAFFGALTASGGAAVAGELERLFLLHTGRFVPLAPERFALVVEHLVALHADRPEAAVGYARFCPDHPPCAAVLRRHGAPVRERLPDRPGAAVEVAQSRAAGAADHTVSLLKSQQEMDFFMAVREVYAAYLVYPNVALSTLVDFDAVRDRLSQRERHYFFRGLVDCVVFDQHRQYRPLRFFELDSPLHDDADRQAKDRYKERILALAGQKLYRIRPAAGCTRAAFVALLRELPA